eukprot:GHRQ01035114.1.p1 GENE.GHRQ01035114.1~~GHRQ01035114.1.p1  ORF type:complete len:132 (+),score=39.61 GHRQ01035114.1:688-1083(+)
MLQSLCHIHCQGCLRDTPASPAARTADHQRIGGSAPPAALRCSLLAVCVCGACSKQLALLGPLRPQPTKVWKRKFVKLMVVGDSGLGKTTLISALLSKPGEQLQVRTGSCGGAARSRNDCWGMPGVMLCGS